MPRKFQRRVAQKKNLKSIHPPTPESEMDESEDQEWEIEKLVDIRGRGAKREYLVKWLGFASKENTWEKVDGLPKDLVDAYDQSDEDYDEEEDNKEASVSPPPRPPSRRKRPRAQSRKRSISTDTSSLDPPSAGTSEKKPKASNNKSKSSAKQSRKKSPATPPKEHDHPSDGDVETSPEVIIVSDGEEAPVTPPVEVTTPQPPKLKRSKRGKRARPVDAEDDDDVAEQPPAKKRKISGAKRTRPGATTGGGADKSEKKKKTTAAKKKAAATSLTRNEESKEEEKADELDKSDDDDLSRTKTPTPMEVDDDDADDGDEDYAPAEDELNDDIDETTTSVSPKRRVSSSGSMDVVVNLEIEKNDSEDGAADEDDDEEGANEDEQWEVEAIVDSRPAQKLPRTKRGKRMVEYQVKWKGWSEEDNSWVHEKDCGGCEKLIEDFEKKTKKDAASSAKTRPRRTRPGKRTLEPSDSSSSPEIVSKRAKRTRSPVTADVVQKWKSWVEVASENDMRVMLLSYSDRASSREISRMAQSLRMNLDE